MTSHRKIEYEKVTDLVYRLRKRAEIRRQIPSRKSVQENKPDRLSDLLEESASELENLLSILNEYRDLDAQFCK